MDSYYTFPELPNNKTKIVGLQVLMLSETDRIRAVRLPLKADGMITFPVARNETVPVHFEAINGRWHAVCSQWIKMINANGDECTMLALHNRQLIPIKYSSQRCFLYVEQIDTENIIFRNFSLSGLSEITIGREKDNDIICSNGLVSSHHARLRWIGTHWKIIDCNSANGVFVNGHKITSEDLRLGDKIYIIGLQIIMGVGFISMNNTGSIRIVNAGLRSVGATFQMDSQYSVRKHRPDYFSVFNRLPRRRIAFNPQKIVIEPPPMSLMNNQIPMLLRMGSSMVMGGTSALAGNYTTLLSAVAFPMLTQRYTDKQRKEYEAKRTETYVAYLNNLRNTILKEKNYEEYVLNENYPSIDTLLSYPFKKRQLWERRKNDDDFLLLRIGHGSVPILSDIEYPKRKFVIEEDELETAMYSIAEASVQIENVPIQTSIIEHNICGFSGERERLLSYIERIILQLAILHSYDEVKMFFLIDSDELEKIDYVKFLPHTWDDSRTIRFIATTPGEAYQVGEYLRKSIEPDFKDTGNMTVRDFLQSRPYFVIFAFDKYLLDSMEFVKELIQKNKNYGVSVLTIFEDMPKECSHIFSIQGENHNNLVFLKEIDREYGEFSVDRFDSELAVKSMSVISNISIKGANESFSLPKSVSFLEMFKVGKIEHLNPQKRWSDSNPIQSLAAPVGIGTDGNLLYLDLHQKYQGPHGLVAGMTGSGKSEFLITYILSMAVNYHPDEVAFVLIDYKGGGLAGAFDNSTQNIHLPHLIGTITNLDGSTIQRSIISIQSELLRRQRDFNKVKDITNEGTMDIYTYQRLYRTGKVKKPMPHLFIISDEFAELKQQQPAFMDDLMSIARIGRSLGVHLILATQKPSGIVNDQIRSNTKFRICLKVQDRNDSTDMLQRPEAAEIKETGRFYLQVGYNEYFALGQSAWCGADYVPSDEVVLKKDDSIQFIDSVGSGILEVKPHTSVTKAVGSQLTAIVKFLSDIADAQNIRPKQLWEKELSGVIDTAALQEEFRLQFAEDYLQVLLGKMDDPANLRQFPLLFDLTHSKNLLIVGSQGSGKSYLLQNIILSLMEQYSLDRFQFYALDYSSRIFKLFSSLPNCGGVLYDEDSDSIDTFFEIINGIVKKRKQLFSSLEVESYDAANAVTPLPVILVIIDNLTELSSFKKGERHFYQLGNYLRECATYGVKYLITCGQISELSARLRYAIEDCIALGQKDKYAYGDALGCRVEYVPPNIPGRGLYKYQDSPLEIQLSMSMSEVSEKERVALIKRKIENAGADFTAEAYAEKMPVISENATYEQFCAQFKRGRIPLGYSKKDAKPVALPFKQCSSLGVYIGNPEGRTPVMENFLYAASLERMQTIVIKKRLDSYFDHTRNEELISGVRIIEPEEKALDVFWNELVATMNERKAIIDEYCLSHGLDNNSEGSYPSYYKHLIANSEPVMLLIESYSDFCSGVSAIGGLIYDKLFTIAQRRNIYVIAVFGQSEEFPAEKLLLLSKFNTDNPFLLLGGNFDKQKICSDEALSQSAFSATLPYNLGIMKYKGGFYPLLMPCGEISSQSIDEDDKDIF